MDPVQPPIPDPPLDRIGTKPERDQLPVGHHTVLSPRQIRDHPVT
jgi:hypothetical protein